MAGGTVAPGFKWYEDLTVGDRWSTGAIQVTEAHVVGFAGLVGDFFELHMDDGFAQEIGFPGRVAHGLLGLGMIDGLKNRCDVHVRAVATLGWDWQFRAPILVGDRIHAEVEIVEMRETRRPDRAILVQAVRALKQDGTVVQEGRHTLMVRRRPGADAA